jgi:neprilysin
MFEMAVLLGAESTRETKQQMFDALELGIALNQLLNGKKFSQNSTLVDVEELQNDLDTIKWLELFDRFKLEKVESLIVNKKIHVYDNLKQLKQMFKPRDFANYLLWRVVDFSSLFLHNEALDQVFKINKKAYGLLDKEQRWKFCTRLANKYAELATGSLYIKEYFSEESRKAALKMADELMKEFKAAIKNADWMDEETQKEATEKLDTLKVYMGYDEQLLDSKKVNNYYGTPKKDLSDSFLLLTIQLNVQKTDKKFKHKFRGERDWTEYAKPTSSKASYNSRDHTICKG